MIRMLDSAGSTLVEWGRQQRAGLCWQHVGGVGSTTTTTTRIIEIEHEFLYSSSRKVLLQKYEDPLSNVFYLFMINNSCHVNVTICK